MREKAIGHVIAKLREEKNISQQELTESLCEVRTLSRIEWRGQQPDVWLFERLLQRLGKSPDKFEIMLSDEEYYELETWYKIDEMLDDGRIEAGGTYVQCQVDAPVN